MNLSASQQTNPVATRPNSLSPDLRFDEADGDLFRFTLQNETGLRANESETEDLDEVDVIDERPAHAPTTKIPLPDEDEPLHLEASEGPDEPLLLAEELLEPASELTQYLVDEHHRTNGEDEEAMDFEITDAEIDEASDSEEPLIAETESVEPASSAEAVVFEGAAKIAPSTKGEAAPPIVAVADIGPAATAGTFAAALSESSAPPPVARAQQLVAEAREIARQQSFGTSRRFSIELPVDRGAPVRLTITPGHDGHQVALVASSGAAREELEKHREQLERVLDTMPLKISGLKIDQRTTTARQDRRPIQQGAQR